MAYVIRADVISPDGGDVKSTHEFWGVTAHEAEMRLEECLDGSDYLNRMDAEDRLIVGDVEEVDDSEVPEIEDQAEETEEVEES